jgi:chromosome segregation ATPase
MESTDATIDVLRKIRAEISGLRSDVNARFAEHGERLEALERHAAATNRSLAELHVDMVTTNETLGLIHHRLGFAEAASAAATAARSRIDDRMDRLEARMEALESKGESTDG